MSKWKVLRDNYGFKNGYWTEGQIVELADQEQPPKEHFVRVERRGDELVPVVVNEKPVRVEGQMAMSELEKAPVDRSEPTGTGKSPVGRPSKK